MTSDRLLLHRFINYFTPIAPLQQQIEYCAKLWPLASRGGGGGGGGGGGRGGGGVLTIVDRLQ